MVGLFGNGGATDRGDQEYLPELDGVGRLDDVDDERRPANDGRCCTSGSRMPALESFATRQKDLLTV